MALHLLVAHIITELDDLLQVTRDKAVLILESVQDRCIVTNDD